jgi:hypothetical protein
VWHVKEPSLRKAVSVKHGSKFEALSPVMVTSRQIAEKLLVQLKTKTKKKRNTAIKKSRTKNTCNIKFPSCLSYFEETITRATYIFLFGLR